MLSAVAALITLAEIATGRRYLSSTSELGIAAVLVSGLVYDLDVPRMAAGKPMPSAVRLYAAILGGMPVALVGLGIAIALTVTIPYAVTGMVALPLSISSGLEFSDQSRLSKRYRGMYDRELETGGDIESRRLILLSRFAVSTPEFIRFFATFTVILEATVLTFVVVMAPAILGSLSSLDLCFGAIFIGWALVLVRHAPARAKSLVPVPKVLAAYDAAETGFWKSLAASLLTRMGILQAYTILPVVILAGVGVYVFAAVVHALVAGSMAMLYPPFSVQGVVGYAISVLELAGMLLLCLVPLYVLWKIFSSSVSRRRHKPLPSLPPGVIILLVVSLFFTSLMLYDRRSFVDFTAYILEGSALSGLLLGGELLVAAGVTILGVRGNSTTLSERSSTRLLVVLIGISSTFYAKAGSLVAVVLFFGLVYVVVTYQEIGSDYELGARARYLTGLALGAATIYMLLLGYTLLAALGTIGVALDLIICLPPEKQRSITRWLVREEQKQSNGD